MEAQHFAASHPAFSRIVQPTTQLCDIMHLNHIQPPQTCEQTMHQPAPQDPDTPDLPDQDLNHLRRSLIGAAAGATLPVLAGFYFVYQFSAYTATLPPDSAVCGTPLVLPFCLFFFVAPVMALIGGVIAALLP